MAHPRDINYTGSGDLFSGGTQNIHIGPQFTGPINLPQLETTPQPSASIPFFRDDEFIDRGDILEQMETYCSTAPRRVALVGLGGVGKSQLEIEYAHRFTARRRDAWVFWIQAGTQAQVQEGLRTIADTVKLPGRNTKAANLPRLVHSWLSDERNGKWLIVIDGADDFDVFFGASGGASQEMSRPLATYLPQSAHGSLVMTSRSRDLSIRLTGSIDRLIDVGPMTRQDAIALLRIRLKPPPDEDMAAELVDALDCVPLAISQAAAYIRRKAPRKSVSDYLATLRTSTSKRATRLLEKDAGDLRRDGAASNAIFTTWQMSIDYIHSKRPSAAYLLSLMSFFNRQGISDRFLRPTTEDKRRGSHTSTASTASSVSSTASSDGDVEFEEDIEKLTDFCLVKKATDGKLEMHRLVQLSTRRWLEHNYRHDELKNAFIRRMRILIPYSDPYFADSWQEFYSHAQLALDYCPDRRYLRAWAKVLAAAGDYAFKVLHDLMAAESLGKKAMSVYMQGMQDDESLVACMRMLSELYVFRDRDGDAEEIATMAYGIFGENSTPTSIKEIMVLMDLTAIYADAGHHEKVDRAADELSEAFRKLPEPSPEDTAKFLDALASIRLEQGRFEDSEGACVEALKLTEWDWDVKYSWRIGIRNTLVQAIYQQGRLPEAEELGRKTLDMANMHHNLDVVSCRDHLADVISLRGRWDDVETLRRLSLEETQKTMGMDHPETIAAMQQVAEALMKQDHLEEAEEILTLARGRLRPGSRDIMRRDVLENLGRVFAKSDQYSKQREVLVELLECCRDSFGEDHEETLVSVCSLAECEYVLGRWREAEALLIQYQEGLETNPESGQEEQDAVRRVWARLMLESARREQGRWHESEESLVQSIQTLEAINARDDRMYREGIDLARGLLAELYTRQGRLDEAQKVRVERSMIDDEMHMDPPDESDDEMFF